MLGMVGLNVAGRRLSILNGYLSDASDQLSASLGLYTGAKMSYPFLISKYVALWPSFNCNHLEGFLTFYAELSIRSSRSQSALQQLL